MRFYRRAEGLFARDPGQWREAEWWHQPNIVESLIFYAKRFPEDAAEVRGVVARVFKKNGCFGFINDFFDDTAWWGRAWASAHAWTGEEKYLRSAEKIFGHLVDEGWDDQTCGGGMRWDLATGYKNAITNELAFSLAARLHLAVSARGESDSRYLEWAHKIGDWIHRAGLINEAGTINDGLDASCANNGGNPWTYNQGIYVDALVDMHQITGERAYLEEAHAIMRANFQHNVENGVLTESGCGGGPCGSDAPQFKGNLIRPLLHLMDFTPPTDPRWSEYASHVRKSADAAWTNRGPDGVFGIHWKRFSPSERPASAQASGLDVMVASAAVSPRRDG